MKVLMLVKSGVTDDARIRREAAALAADGYEVTVIGDRPGPDHPISDVTVLYCRPAASRASWADRSPVRSALRWLLLPTHRRLDDRAFVQAAARAGDAIDADVVHAHDLTGLRAAQRCCRPKAKLVYDAHECWTGRSLVGRPNPLGRVADAICELRLGRRADIVLTVSDELADWLRTRRGFCDVRIVQNTSQRRNLAPPHRPHAVHYGGRIDQERDLATVAQGAASVAGIELIVRGTADAGVAAALAELGVRVLPPIPTGELAGELAEAGIGLVPLAGDGINHAVALPNKLFEAVQAGVPVVAADLPAIRRVVDKFGLGALYIPGDPDSFAAALQSVVAEYPAYRTAVEAARDALSWEHDATLLVASYREMLGRSAEPPDVAIVSVARDDGDARVERLASALVALNLDVEVHALAPATTSDPQVRRVLRRRRGIIVRLARACSLPFTVSAVVLVVVDPDLFLPARLARLGCRRTVVCDVFEDYKLVVDDRAWASRRVVREIARRCARAAQAAARGVDLTLVADDHVPPLDARERLVVRNLPQPARSQRSGYTARPTSAYVGDVRVSRGALEMIEGVRATDDWELDIVGPIHEGDRDEIMSAIADDPRIRIHGRRSPDESWRIVEGASVGLSLLHITPAFAKSMPTKVYEYANAGMAVITSPLLRPAALVAEHGFGAVAAGSCDIRDTLTRWRAEPDELVLCRQRAAAWADAHLGGLWPPAVAATRIKTMVDERSEPT